MIFSVRQLQEKCREQNQPLYLAFIDVTKAFDLVSRDGLFRMLPFIGCPPKLLSIEESFHDGMRSTVQFDGDFSNNFHVKSGVKQGCVLAPILFGIFFSLLLKHAFKSSTDGIYLHSRSDGHLFDIARLRGQSTSEICCLLTMQLSSPTQKKDAKGYWTGSPTPVIFLASQSALKWYCDENHIFPIEPILKHKQVACMKRKMLFTIFKYLFSFQRYLSF